MNINELLDQGVTLQGTRRVSGWKGNLDDGGEVIFYEGSDEWGWASLDEEDCPWAEYEINYMYASEAHKGGCMMIELDVPEDEE